MKTSDPEPRLNERAQHLFRTLVQRYILDGQPVGSRTLSKDSGLSLSPATVRNVMADLEECGLLSSPHTSAGRIPTVKGYRFFIDTLLKVTPIDGSEVENHLREQLVLGRGREALMETASSILSDVTHMAGVVLVPRQEHLWLRHVEFLALSERQVLAILVVNGREVQNRIIETGRSYTQSELQEAGNYLNEVCGGRDLMLVREDLLRELRSARESMNQRMLTAIEIADKAFVSEHEPEEIVVAGQTNLMGYGELADMERLRELFEAFRQKTDLLHILDQCLRADGIQIFIGEESGYEPLGDCSVITAPYESDGEILGVLGVIGPTRMAYDRVIPIVDLTARLLGAALNPRS